MRHAAPNDAWPESWKYSYPYDLQEVYGHFGCQRYAYAYENRRSRTMPLVGGCRG